MKNGHHEKTHITCCVKPILGGLFWMAAFLALLAAWLARVSPDRLIWGIDEGHWYLDALVLGILALGCKIHSLGACNVCASVEKPVKKSVAKK